MTDWDTAGLPPAAMRRMEGVTKNHIKSSMLSVAGATGVMSNGFTPVSEVMGAIVLNTTGATMPYCGYYSTSYGLGMNQVGFGRFNQVVTNGTSQSNYNMGYLPYIDIINSGWSKAIGRMELEARAVKADGIVGIRLQQNHLGSGSVEFVAIGTAIRSNVGSKHLSVPFSTHLDGVDAAKLFQNGYAPARILVEVSVGVRHDDYITMSQSSVFAYNTEISGHTELVTSARANARRRLEAAVRSSGADGAIIDSLTLSIFENEPSENHRDHLAEVKIVGTSIVSVQKQHQKSRPLTFLSLKDK